MLRVSSKTQLAEKREKDLEKKVATLEDSLVKKYGKDWESAVTISKFIIQLVKEQDEVLRQTDVAEIRLKEKNDVLAKRALALVNINNEISEKERILKITTDRIASQSQLIEKERELSVKATEEMEEANRVIHKNSLEQANNQLQEMQAKIKNKEAEVEEIKKEIKLQEIIRDQIATQIQENQVGLQGLLKKIDTCNDSLASIEEAIVISGKKLEQFDEIESKKEELSAEVEKVKQEISQTNLANEELLETMKTDRLTIKDEQEKLQQERAVLQREYETLEGSKNQMRRALKRLNKFYKEAGVFIKLDIEI